MKITGSWDVESSSRPGMKHRVTRYEIPTPTGSQPGAEVEEKFACSCEAGYYGSRSCQHIKHVKAELPPKSVDDGWRLISRDGTRELQENAALALYRTIHVVFESFSYPSARRQHERESARWRGRK